MTDYKEKFHAPHAGQDTTRYQTNKQTRWIILTRALLTRAQNWGKRLKDSVTKN